MKQSFAIKFADESQTKIDILAIPFGGPFLDANGQGQDLYGEHFSAKTNLCLDWYETRPLLFGHGLDPDVDKVPVGHFTSDSIRMADEGVWIQAQLDANSEYCAAIQKLVRKGKLYASSGAMAHLVETDTKSGEILVWPWVEESLTPTPANLFATVDFADAEKHFKAAGLRFVPAGGMTMANLKAKLDAEEEGKLDDSDFAYIDKDGNRHLPIKDEAHVRDALSRFGETDFESDDAKKKAAKKILARAKELGIDVGDDDPVRKAAGEEAKKKSRKAMQEASDSAGGAMVSDLPAGHESMDGSHDHMHSHVDSGGNVYSHSHDHAHDGDNNHVHDHRDARITVSPEGDHGDTDGAHSHTHEHTDANGQTYTHTHDHMHDDDANHDHDHSDARKSVKPAKTEQTETKPVQPVRSRSLKAVSYEEIGSEVASLAQGAVQDDPFDYGDWVYPFGTYDGYVILCRSDWDEGRNYYYRVPYELDADGHVATISRPEPVEMEFAPSQARSIGAEAKAAFFRLQSGMAAMRSLYRNTKSYAQRRIKEGREISKPNHQALTNIVGKMRDHHDALDDTIGEFEDFLNKTDPSKKVDPDATTNEPEPAAQATADPTEGAKALSVKQRAQGLSTLAQLASITERG